MDCGANKTVCGKEWLTQYINNLSDTDQSKVLYGESNHIYRFGDSAKENSLHSVEIPAIIRTHNLESKQMLLTMIYLYYSQNRQLKEPIRS